MKESCTGNHKQSQNKHKNSSNNDSSGAARFQPLFVLIHIITGVASAAEKLTSLRSLSPTAFPSLNTLNAGKPLCNSSCFHSSVNIPSEEVGAALASTPPSPASTDSSGPAATVTTFYRCFRSIYWHVSFMNSPAPA